MLHSGVAITLCLFIALSAGKSVSSRLSGQSILPTSFKMARYIEGEDEVSRMFAKTVKSALIRVIKFYRTVKPEIILASCFSRYAGILQGRSYQCDESECERMVTQGLTVSTGRAESDNAMDATVQQLLRDMVHAVMLFTSDLMPQPVSTMMGMVMEMWRTAMDMYKAFKQDEMGNCSLEYMSKRFWWWLGI